LLNTNITSLPYANEVLCSLCLPHAIHKLFMRLLGRGVGGQLN